MTDEFIDSQDAVPADSIETDWSADETDLVIQEREAFQEALYALPHSTTQELERTARQIFREACDRVGLEMSSDIIRRLDDQIAASNISENAVSGAPFSAATAQRFYAEAAQVADEHRQAEEAAELVEDAVAEGGDGTEGV